MSIASFVKASEVLLREGMDDVALAIACSAVDATAKKLFPRLNNNERNKRFLRERLHTITEFGFPGLRAGGIRVRCSGVEGLKPDENGMVGIEDVIYHAVRCSLIHQCEVDSRIRFTESTVIGDFEQDFSIPCSLINGLLEAVRREKCNSVEFGS